MISVQEQLQRLQAIEGMKKPTDYVTVPDRRRVHPLMALLLNDEVLSSAIPELADSVDSWQKQRYLRKPIPLFADVDPQDLEIEHLLASFKSNFSNLSNPHIGCSDKSALAGEVFRNAVALRTEIDKVNKEVGAFQSSVGFLMPSQVHFSQGEYASFNPNLPGLSGLNTEIWIPPSVEQVSSEVVQLKDRMVTNYWSQMVITPVGSELEHPIEIRYSQER